MATLAQSTNDENPTLENHNKPITMQVLVAKPITCAGTNKHHAKYICHLNLLQSQWMYMELECMVQPHGSFMTA